MFKIIYFTLLFILSSLLVLGQDNLPLNQNDKSINRLSTYLIDYKIYNNDLYINHSFYRDSDIKIDSVIFERYSNIETIWLPKRKYVYLYNAMDDLVGFVYYERESDEWASLYKEDYGVDGINRTGFHIESFWDNVDEQWELSYKEEHEYNVDMKDSISLIYYWDKDLLAWINDYKFEYKYYSNNLFDSIVSFKSNNNGVDWKVDKKTIFNYNSVSSPWLLDTIKYYTWQDDPVATWVPVIKKNYLMGDYGVIEYSYNFFISDEWNVLMEIVNEYSEEFLYTHALIMDTVKSKFLYILEENPATGIKSHITKIYDDEKSPEDMANYMKENTKAYLDYIEMSGYSWNDTLYDWKKIYIDKFYRENPVKIYTASVIDITQTTAKSGGDISNDGGCYIDARGVVWSTEPNPTIDVYEGKTQNGNGGGSFESNINGLEPDMTYYIRSYATNTMGTTYGNQLQFETLIEDLTVYTTSISNVYINSATAGGNVSKDGGYDVNERGVVWHTSNNPTIAFNLGKTVDGSGLGTYQSSITGLEPDTIYYIRAYATNNVETRYGDELQFETLADIKITTNLITDISQNSAKSGGNIDDDKGKVIIEKGVVWSFASSPTIDTNEGITSDGSGAEFISEITDLMTNSFYYVRAYASYNNGAVCTVYGNELSFQTLDFANCGIITDEDGNDYATVIIDNLCWMKENLKTTKYNDGDSIPYVTDSLEWIISDDAYCWYDNDYDLYGDYYGALYSWHAVNSGK